jgi:hypothetical protein
MTCVLNWTLLGTIEPCCEYVHCERKTRYSQWMNFDGSYPSLSFGGNKVNPKSICNSRSWTRTDSNFASFDLSFVHHQVASVVNKKVSESVSRSITHYCECRHQRLVYIFSKVIEFEFTSVPLHPIFLSLFYLWAKFSSLSPYYSLPQTIRSSHPSSTFAIHCSIQPNSISLPRFHLLEYAES